MLFQQLYNWIKYKTLPASFLFKNRLYIERDSKHKRIFTNFGLSFRNSKWTNYENSNIKFNFKFTYFKFLIYFFFLLILLFIIYHFNSYYVNFYFLNNISFFFWISLDTFDYYLSFIIWIITIFFSLFFNLIYSFFFFNNFSNKNYNTQFTYLKKNNLNNEQGTFFLNKHDLNWFLYLWLTNDKVTNSLLFKNLFTHKVNQNWWNNYYDFFPKLYKLTHILNLINEKTSLFFLKNKLNNLQINDLNLNTHLSYLNNNTNLNEYFNFFFFYNFFIKKNYLEEKLITSPSLKFLYLKNEWNLNTINIELKNYNSLINSKTNTFLLDFFNYQNLIFLTTNYSELLNLNIFFKNQLNISKWNKWLYKYSILHRKIFKNSHKITLSKKLLNGGFFNNILFNKNIWTSELLNKYDNQDNKLISTIYNLNYSNLLILNSSLNTNLTYLNINGNFNEKNNFNLINFYEQSYFWFLKRFYYFNTLNTNTIKSKSNKNSFSLNKFLLNSNENINTINKYNLILSYLLKSSNSGLLIFLNNKKFNISNLQNNNFLINQFLLPNKDLYLNFNDNDLLSKDNLNILYWLTINTSSQINKINYFNYLNVLNLQNDSLIFNFYFKTNINKNEINMINFFTLINIDKIFVNDLNYFTLFN